MIISTSPQGEAPTAAKGGFRESKFVCTTTASISAALLLAFGVLGVACTVPILTALQAVKNPWSAFFLIVAAWLILSAYTSINAVVKAELFPAAVRVSGVAFPYAVAVSIFGGSAEYIALWFKNAGHEEWFYWYVTLVIFCSLLVYFLMPDTKKTSRIDAERVI